MSNPVKVYYWLELVENKPIWFYRITDAGEREPIMLYGTVGQRPHMEAVSLLSQEPMIANLLMRTFCTLPELDSERHVPEWLMRGD